MLKTFLLFHLQYPAKKGVLSEYKFPLYDESKKILKCIRYPDRSINRYIRDKIGAIRCIDMV